MLQWVDVDVPAPGVGEIRVRHHAVGLNFIDVYSRTGLYPQPLPAGLGMEAAGEVVDVGPGVTDFAPGERIAYATRPPGAYAQERVIAASSVVKLPQSISYEQGAAMMLQGMAAQYLLRRVVRRGRCTSGSGGPAHDRLINLAALAPYRHCHRRR